MTSISGPRPGASSATPQRADDYADDPLCQCQGCGAYRGLAWLGKPHNCHRNDDGTYEEGGTFQ